MFPHRNDTWIVIRHESELLPNLSIQMRVEPLRLFEAVASED
jgi:hypothetical protein